MLGTTRFFSVVISRLCHYVPAISILTFLSELRILPHRKETREEESAMPCRVGITTDPDRRRAEWEAEVVGLSGWRRLGTYPTKAQAQAHEDDYARKTGCLAHAGGPAAAGPWHVYRFDYIRTR